MATRAILNDAEFTHRSIRTMKHTFDEQRHIVLKDELIADVVLSDPALEGAGTRVWLTRGLEGSWSIALRIPFYGVAPLRGSVTFLQAKAAVDCLGRLGLRAGRFRGEPITLDIVDIAGRRADISGRERRACDSDSAIAVYLRGAEPPPLAYWMTRLACVDGNDVVVHERDDDFNGPDTVTRHRCT